MALTRARPALTAADYRILADLRYHIRRFLHVRETAARMAGLEPQQYLLLLQIKARDETSPPTIAWLAERLQIRHHSAVGLVDRLAQRDLVVRRPANDDRRQVLVELRPAGEAILRRLVEHSIRELRADGPALVSALTRLIGPPRRSIGRRRRRTEIL